MIFRVYAEKKEPYASEAQALLWEINQYLGMREVTGLRLLNRYDVEGIDEATFLKSKTTVFSDPPVDYVHDDLPAADAVLACAYQSGQFDQRADSAAQCIQVMTKGEKPTVRSARVYLLYGDLSEKAVSRLSSYLINPVDSMEVSLERPDTLAVTYPTPPPVEVLDGLITRSDEELAALRQDLLLAMDLDDLVLIRDYFRSVDRDPTIAEIRLFDTYWSDHCRHTTFMTHLENIELEDAKVTEAYARYLDIKRELGREDRPTTLMDIATIGTRYHKKKGLLPLIDESAEINACTVRTTIRVDGTDEDWLLLFKNETHNHPTEIEPFGGASTCIGGAIRDPLAGRAYVHMAMRISGAADPRSPIDETLPGKLPQRQIVTKAAEGNSSYGNQIGVASGLVDEIYHPGYLAKHMELGAVMGAVPLSAVVREEPLPGDVVLLIGGKTGRDGIGGATGSSKKHDSSSLEMGGAEVQKGNAPEERKILRLFRNSDATRLIKRCNDFGAGGVSVAVGELADGIEVTLDAVPKKYEGLDGTELAISESQERMAVVVAEKDKEAFIRLAEEENLDAVQIAKITEEKRLVMFWRGEKIIDIERAFLDTNGAAKRAAARVLPSKKVDTAVPQSFRQGFLELAGSLDAAAKRGMTDRFCSTIGAGTLLLPLGGRYQQSPTQCMAAKFPLEKGETDAAAVMSYGFDPAVSERDPYRGAYLAVVESLAKLAAAGGLTKECYLTFQEYFESLKGDPIRWGKPLSALLGALDAQLDYGVSAIGGKDSMSGTFEQLDVPPTLVSFAVSVGKAEDIRPSCFESAGHPVLLLKPSLNAETDLPEPDSQRQVFANLQALAKGGRLLSAYAVTRGGIAKAVFSMSIGNRIGFRFEDDVSEEEMFCTGIGSIVAELTELLPGEQPIGYTTDEASIDYRGESLPLKLLEKINRSVLEDVYPSRTATIPSFVPVISHTGGPAVSAKPFAGKPLALIPVFPGTNGEYDMARAAERAGLRTELFVVRNRSAEDITRSAELFCDRLTQAKLLLLPGGFSSGDEPDGSGKFIAAFFRNPAVKDAIAALLEQSDGLILGICNGFQALLKLGLLPFGEIVDRLPAHPALAPNLIGRHQSRMVRVRIASDKSPWLSNFRVGEIDTMPISHGEGRFVVADAVFEKLAANGQIASQYVDLTGQPTMDIDCNPAGSTWAVEGLLSPNGRVFGRMGHSERMAPDIYRNMPFRSERSIFDGAANYYR